MGNGWPVESLGEISNVKIGPLVVSFTRKIIFPMEFRWLIRPHIVNMKICPDFNLSISDQKRKGLQAYLLKTKAMSY